MKKYLSITLISLFSLCAIAQHQLPDSLVNDKAAVAPGVAYGFSFLGKERVPDGMAFLQSPPTEKDPLYKNDVARYNWGKSMRQTLRGDTAIWDARTDIAYYMQRMGWAIGLDITPEKCPNLTKLIKGALQDIRGGMQHAKDTYARHRPYQVFKEHTSLPKYERDDDYTSFPSGHSVRAWSLALLFVAIDPVDQDAIMKVGADMCDSRVILGYHFQSDVEAAKLCASAGFARLCAEPTFWAYLQLAHQEIEDLKAAK